MDAKEMVDFIDQPKAIRPGEELSINRLEAFLKDHLPGLEGELILKQFPHGNSNLTYSLSVGSREMVLRRPPFGTKAKTAHDMGREFRMLSALRPVYPYCPEPLLYSEDESIIGSPFYVMARIKGIIAKRDLPPGLNLTPRQVRRLFLRLLEVHYELHAVDYHRIGLAGYGKPEGYVARQVKGWNQRYRAARTPDAPDCERVMAWLEEKMPPDTDRPGVIHNDYRLDNVVLDPVDPLNIIGVLDWEMATVGDPLMDLGGSLAYWVEPGDPEEMQRMRVQPTNLPGALTRKEVLAEYSRLSGRVVDNFDFYYCFGLFRLAVIVQQIYYRFYHGQTQDQRFQPMIHMVTLLDRAANRVLDRSDL